MHLDLGLYGKNKSNLKKYRCTLEVISETNCI